MAIEVQVYDKTEMRYIENDEKALLKAAGFDERLSVSNVALDDEGGIVVLESCGHFNWLDPGRYELIIRFTQ